MLILLYYTLWYSISWYDQISWYDSIS